MILGLPPEQEALLPIYQQKWHQIAISTEPIDARSAIAAIQHLYSLIAPAAPPNIIVCASPQDVFQTLLTATQTAQPVGENLTLKLEKRLRSELFALLESQLNQRILNLLHEPVFQQFYQAALRVDFSEPIFNHLGLYDVHAPFAAIAPHILAGGIFTAAAYQHWGCLSDFCVEVLNCPYDRAVWQSLWSALSQTYWIVPFSHLCIICDRPKQLTLDEQNRLHAEGKPAIQFADGYSLHAHRGVILPEKYSQTLPHLWQAQWVLEEPNAELRRALIQGIGYGRLCQELDAIELDSWNEYTLLKVDADADLEPIVLLKMTCPSTHFIHVLRVPPSITSARSAIRWVNHDIDPEEFAVQS